MDLKECYRRLGGDFDGVMGRLRREQMIAKFVIKFLDDKSFALFESSMAEKNYDEALRAVHTLKGICQNLSFTQLFESSYAVTKALKEKNVEQAQALAPQLSRDYQRVIGAVEEYRRSVEG